MKAQELHPKYINDYIDKIKAEINTDLEVLSGAITEVKKNKNKYEQLEYDWHITHINANAHLFKHSLYQLYKLLEKEPDGTE